MVGHEMPGEEFYQGWLFSAAHRLGIGAAGSETAGCGNGISPVAANEEIDFSTWGEEI